MIAKFKATLSNDHVIEVEQENRNPAYAIEFGIQTLYRAIHEYVDEAMEKQGDYDIEIDPVKIEIVAE